MRLPVRVMRSFAPTTTPASLTRAASPRPRALERVARHHAEPAQDGRVGVERMRGEVKADRLRLEAEPLHRRPVRHVGQAQRLRAGRRRRTGRSGRSPSPPPRPARAAGSSRPRRTAGRGCGSSVSNAPARIRFSSCIWLSWRGSTRAAKSARSANGRVPARGHQRLHRRVARPSSPPPARSGWRALPSSCRSTAKSAPERLMSGGRMRMPMRSASCFSAASRSVLLSARLMQAAMNTTGWFAFIQAVW